MKKNNIFIKVILIVFCLVLVSMCYYANRPIVDYRLNPLSYREFRDNYQSSILPKCSYNIYCSSHREGMQIFSSFMRFEVPEDQMDKTVKFLIEVFFVNKKKEMRKSKNIDQFINIPDTLSPLPWWDVKSIKNGYSIEDKNGGDTIWVDNEKSIIYIYCNQ